MNDFGLAWKGTARPGGHCWINGGAYRNAWDAPRGYATVYDDGSTWFYKVSRSERKTFKAWVRDTFANYGERSVVGRWPHYDIGPRP